ncbi:MAG: 3'-5' exonuclease [Stappiaceae bacterium]
MNLASKLEDRSVPSAGSVPDGLYRFIALDVETSCGDVASICQIGLACVGMNNRIEGYSAYVNPQMRFDPFNIQIHGIRRETVAQSPTFPAVWATLLPLLEKHRLVQHSNFDKAAISAACAANGLPSPDLHWSDSVAIAKKAWPEFRGNGGHGLANLKRTLGLEFNHHDAGEDARAAAQVVLHAEKRLKTTFERIAGAIRPIQLAFPFFEKSPL